LAVNTIGDFLLSLVSFLTSLPLDLSGVEHDNDAISKINNKLHQRLRLFIMVQLQFYCHY
jgi:hypothetical protein